MPPSTGPVPETGAVTERRINQRGRTVQLGSDETRATPTALEVAVGRGRCERPGPFEVPGFGVGVRAKSGVARPVLEPVITEGVALKFHAVGKMTPLP